MRKTIIATALAAAWLAGGSTYAVAQEAPPPPGPGGMLMRADTNNDGIITRAEWLADVDRRFAQADANNDGKISAEERDALRARAGGEGRGGGRMGGRADTDGDGFVSLAEQRAQATERFDRIDANRDGQIDQAERERLAAMRGGPDGRRGPPPPPPPAGAPSTPNGN